MADNGSAGNQRMCRDHPNYSITEISKNTEQSPGDLGRLAVTQKERPSANASMKTCKEYDNNNNNKKDITSSQVNLSLIGCHI